MFSRFRRLVTLQGIRTGPSPLLPCPESCFSAAFSGLWARSTWQPTRRRSKRPLTPLTTNKPRETKSPAACRVDVSQDTPKLFDYSSPSLFGVALGSLPELLSLE